MQPNILVFFTDQQRFDTTGMHGNPLGLTPNFDRMARAGTHINTMFTPQPVCGPARACLQTGKYATTTGCFRNGIPLPKPEKTLANYFSEGGYDTAYIGKWHLAANEHIGPVPRDERGGYEYWLASNLLEFTSDSYDLVLYDNDGNAQSLPGYRVDAQTDAVIRYLSQPREKPFFLFVSYLEPHQQNHRDDYPAPDCYKDTYTGRWTPPDLAALGGTSAQHLGGYYGMVKRLDEALGRIQDALKSLGLSDNTILAYTSDHGCHFKTRNKEYKRSCHESSIRVPCALTGPYFRGGGERSELISLLDLPPTLLDAANIPIPNGMQGRSFLPLVKRETTSWPQDVFVQISESEVGRALRTERWKYAVTAKDLQGWVTPSSERYEESYLYDLEADPYELTNLVGLESHRALSDVLMNQLQQRMLEAGEAKADITPAPARKDNQRKVSTSEIPIFDG
ncbi:MAG: sulfatase-like hydrolase/transferase [Trueperaceae bacterium]